MGPATPPRRVFVESNFLVLDTSLNRIVRFQIVADQNLESALAQLPSEVSKGLAAELRASEEAQRYDRHAQRAYYFRHAGSALKIWIWHEVENHEEAAKLLTLAIEVDGELDESAAADLYERATGRGVDRPRSDYPANVDDA